MVERITIDTYFEKYASVPIVDVRSPGEFFKGHIPNATNIALFTDAERAQVGTAYKQVSREKAIELGYVFVTPKLDYYVSASKQLAPNNTIAVHCWRGGMRSEAFANHLHAHGFATVYVIEKGYKAYRNYVLSFFEKKFKLLVLGGYTGSGKTDILKQLQASGQQVVDLEGLADHKGSAFGGIGQAQQSSVEQFENNLCWQLWKLQTNKPIWIEDESNNIGNINIPNAFFTQIRESSVIFIDIPPRERALYLAETYGKQDKVKLHEAILRISKRLGPLNTKIAIEALAHDKLLKVAETVLIYYDKTYLTGLQRRNAESISKIELNTVNAELNTQILLNYVNRN